MLGVTLSCTRGISVPVSPSISQGTNTFTSTITSTITNTQTATPSQTPSLTPTATGANTATNTPTGTPSNTMTPTNSYTPSPTGQATATNTPTNTPSGTPTLTATSTVTNTVTNTVTPTPNPNMIADFEESTTALQDVTTNGLGLTGYWYSVIDASGSTAVTALETSGASGCSAGNYVSIGGTTGPSGNIYAELQGDFINTVTPPTTPYNITANAPANTNAFIFCIKGTVPGNQVWFAVSDAATTASSDNAGFYVPVTSSWTSVTVCFNHMQSQGWALPGHMFDPTTAVSFSWKVTTPASPYNFQVDNFQFGQVGGAVCPSFTPTPTPNYALLDDFEGTGTAPSDSTTQIYTVQDQNGNWRDGAVFNYTDTINGSTATTAISAGNPGSAIEFSGTLATQGSYAGVGFNFTNSASGAPHNAGVSFYDGTVGGNYNGIRFDIKVNSIPATNCAAQPIAVDLVDMNGGGVTTDHKIVFPVTSGSWQSVTVYYNQFLSSYAYGSSSTPLDSTRLYQMQFQPQSNGTPGYAYDFSVDNIQFVNGAAPAAAATRGQTVVDDMTIGSNQIEFTTGTSVPGYWYDYEGTGSTNQCPAAGAFFLSTPGHTAQSIFGIPSFAVHFSGTNTDYGGLGFWFTNGNTYTNISAWTQLVFYAKSSTPLISWNITFNDSTTNSCYGSSVNTTSFAPGAAWGAVTLTYNPSNGSYQFGTATGTSGTNGCAGAPTFTNHQFDPTNAANIQWEPGSGTYDLWIDDLYLQ